MPAECMLAVKQIIYEQERVMYDEKHSVGKQCQYFPIHFLVNED